ncbi:hypothetical protein [Nostoc commune]|uniref:hypothetical protein n=1 Tax=Nostoc commune TaxID=1178 RepID=UPI00396A9933
MTTIDSAKVYGKGHSERIVAEALSNVRVDVLQSSPYSPSSILRQALASLFGRRGDAKSERASCEPPNPEGCQISRGLCHKSFR